MLPADRIAIVGVVLSVVALGYCYVLGSVLRTPRIAPQWPAALADSGSALLDAVVTTCSGIAILGFATFALGLAGLLYPVALAFVLGAAAVACALLGDPPTSVAFWRRRWTALRRAASPGAVIVVVIALFLAYPAVMPDIGSDATVYHHAYALDWARAHGLTVDKWLRAPLYANNWVLIAAWVYAMHGIAYVEFLTWVTGLLTMLGVYAYVVAHAAQGPVGRWNGVQRQLIGIAAVVTMSTAPHFLHVLDSAMTDVPTGLFYFAFAAAGVMAIRRAAPYAVWDLAACAGFLIGMKISFIALLPLAAVAAAICARAAGLRRNGTLLAAALTFALGIPWYARNFVLDGDPVAPVLNLALRGKDAYFSRADWINGAGSIAVDHSPGALLSLPWHAFVAPAPLQDVGVNLVMLLLWLPAVLAVWALITNHPVTRHPSMLVAAFLLYGYAYWTLTSYFIRYSLLFYPLLCAFIGSLAILLFKRVPRAGWLVAIALLVLAVPSPSSASFYRDVWINNYVALRLIYTDRRSWLETHSPGYREVEYIGHVMTSTRRTDLRVYRLNFETLTLAFKLEGLDSIGEWWGPERYEDFRLALDRDDLPQYIARFDIGVVAVPERQFGTILSADDYADLDDVMHDMGFRRVAFPHGALIMYFSPQLGPLPPVPAGT